MRPQRKPEPDTRRPSEHERHFRHEQIESIKNIEKVLSTFGGFDRNMQISTALTLLNVMIMENQAGGLTTKDIEKKLGMRSATASRNVLYWGEGSKESPKSGYSMVEFYIDPNDRRRRVLRLTEKGRVFMAVLDSMYSGR